MSNCCINQLRDKEVINTCDGRRLGYVYDVEIDLCCGKLTAIIVPGEIRCLGFGRGKNIRIPWDCIERIGDDIILVNAGGLDLHCRHDKENGHEKEKKRFF